jgi:chromosomal replication initiator protein
MFCNGKKITLMVMNSYTIEKTDKNLARWRNLISSLRNSPEVSTYELGCLFSAKVTLFTDDVIIIVSEEQEAVDAFNHKLIPLLEKINQELKQPPVEIIIRLAKTTNHNTSSKSDDSENSKSSPTAKKPLKANDSLATHLLFEDFVVGEPNALAHGCAFAVAQNPHNLNLNPLYVYGDSGLGKTHLLHAIGNSALERDSKTLVHYTTMEQYYSEYLFAHENGKSGMNKFHTFFRNLDYLLVDDITWALDNGKIKGSGTIFQDFFNTFNELQLTQKQVIISGDVPPRHLHPLGDRFVSCLLQGYSATLGTLDDEMKLSLFVKKGQRQHLPMTPEILEYLIRKPFTNIREIDGCINKIAVWSHVFQNKITLDSVHAAIDSYFVEQHKEISVSQIVSLVAHSFDIKEKEIFGPGRSSSVALARQLAMYLTQKHCMLSTNQIGSFFGGRDHSTVIYSCRKIEKRLKTDNKLSKICADLVKNF